MNNDYETQEVKCDGLAKGFSKKLMFFAIGGGVGAAVALLLAPKSGKEIREDIVDLAGKGYDKTMSAANEVKQRTEGMYATAKEKGTEVLEVVSAGALAIGNEISGDLEKIDSIVDGRREQPGYTRSGIF